MNAPTFRESGAGVQMGGASHSPAPKQTLARSIVPDVGGKSCFSSHVSSWINVRTASGHQLILVSLYFVLSRRARMDPV